MPVAARLGARLSGWLPRAWIPNREGFRVRLLLQTGAVRDDGVVFRKGIFVLDETPITCVAGWKPRDAREVGIG